MIVTREVLVNKLKDYLSHHLSLNDLIDWAERAMMEAEFDEGDVETLSDIIARLALADVRAFGLTWEDCDEFLKLLGYQARVSLVPA